MNLILTEIIVFYDDTLPIDRDLNLIYVIFQNIRQSILLKKILLKYTVVKKTIKISDKKTEINESQG